MVEKLRFEFKSLGFESEPYYRAGVWHWASYLPSMRLSFLLRIINNIYEWLVRNEKMHINLWAQYLASATQLCLILCDSMDCSMPGFPVLHYLPELAQTHVHWVGADIQPSHPLSSPSPPAFSLSQHVYTRDLFTVSGFLPAAASFLSADGPRDFLYQWTLWPS